MILALAAALTLAAQNPRDPMLVSTEWLSQHQRDANLVLLQIGPRASYDSAHIAGAQLIAFSDIAQRDSTKPALELPPVAWLDSVLESKGISDNSRIVIYQSDEWFTPATRVYYTLYWAGLGARTSILDGGLAEWRRHRGPVTREAPTVRPGSLTLHPRNDAVVTSEFVLSKLSDPRVAIVDARNEQFYLGNYYGPQADPRPGHIPGAFNIPFPSMVTDSGMMKSPEELRNLFLAAHAEPGDTVISYCHIGQQGTLVWFGAKLAGYEARLYDNSFTVWSRLAAAQYPVERP